MANGRASVPARELSSINFRSMIGGPLLAVVQAQAQSAMSSVDFIKSVGFKPNPEDPEGVDAEEPIYVSFKYPKEVAPYEPGVPGAILSISVAPGVSGYNAASPPDATLTGGTQVGATAAADVTTATTVSPAGEIVSVTIPDVQWAIPPTACTVPPPSSGTAAPAITVQRQEAEEAKPAIFQEMRLEVPILTMLPIPFIRVEEATIDFNAKINSIEEAATNSTFKLAGEMKYRYKAEVGVSLPIKLVSLLGKISSSVDMKVSSSYQKNTSSGYKVDRTYSMNVHVRAVQDEVPAGIERLLGILEDNIKSQPTDAAPAEAHD